MEFSITGAIGSLIGDGGEPARTHILIALRDATAHTNAWMVQLMCESIVVKHRTDGINPRPCLEPISQTYSHVGER